MINVKVIAAPLVGALMLVIFCNSIDFGKSPDEDPKLNCDVTDDCHENCKNFQYLLSWMESCNLGVRYEVKKNL